jgi:hypothetical protein
MHVIVTIDDNGGMLFNHRRQSRDAIVNERILSMIGDKKLFINNFSWKMLKYAEDKLNVTEHFLDIAEKGDFCFVEDKHLKEYEDKIESIYVFKWNRDYPHDFDFDINLDEWNCTSFEEFAGFSHESIYLEKYVKKNEEASHEEI